MRRAVAPILATAVVLSGAAMVVANPIVSAPADIRVSVTDLDQMGDKLDILDPYFLESVGAVRAGWPSAIATLDALLSSLAKDASTVSPDVLAEAIGRAAEVDPQIGQSYSAEIGGVRSGPALVITDPTASTVVALRALANLSSAFGKAGVTLAQQVGMAPAVILKLTEQILDGTVPPEEALRRLMTAPFGTALTRRTVITGDPRIDAVFEENVITPILEALGEAMPPPPGPATAADANATPDRKPPAGEPSNTAATPARSATLAEGNGPTALAGGGSPTTGDDVGGTHDGGAARITDSPGYRPGDIARGIQDRIHMTIEDLDRAVDRLTELDRTNPDQDANDDGDGSGEPGSADATSDAGTVGDHSSGTQRETSGSSTGAEPGN